MERASERWRAGPTRVGPVEELELPIDASLYAATVRVGVHRLAKRSLRAPPTTFTIESLLRELRTGLLELLPTCKGGWSSTACVAS